MKFGRGRFRRGIIEEGTEALRHVGTKWAEKNMKRVRAFGGRFVSRSLTDGM